MNEFTQQPMNTNHRPLSNPLFITTQKPEHTIELDDAYAQYCLTSEEDVTPTTAVNTTAANLFGMISSPCLDTTPTYTNFPKSIAVSVSDTLSNFDAFDTFWKPEQSFDNPFSMPMKPEQYIDDSFMALNPYQMETAQATHVPLPERRTFGCHHVSDTYNEQLMRNIPTAAKSSKSREWKCFIPGCEKTLGTGPGLRYHLLHFHGRKIPVRVDQRVKAPKRTEWKCGTCDKRWVTKAGFKYHVKKNHPELEACLGNAYNGDMTDFIDFLRSAL
jgi:hypothetical protein